MPNYIVKVTYSYPCQAVNAEDALSTVPYVVKGRFIGFHGEGKTEILKADTGEVVLTAKLKIGGEVNENNHLQRRAVKVAGADH